MMISDFFTAADVEQLAEAGISPESAEAQLDFLLEGAKPLKLNRPCTVGDGIITLPREEMEEMVKRYDQAALGGRVMKFVPASGAASRMFSHWHSALAKKTTDRDEFDRLFAANLPKFAFFQDLKESMASRGEDIEILLKENNLRRILHGILSPEGLNYGHLPKALLKFHVYKEGSRTAIEEHLVEAALFTENARRECRIHFTLSEEHERQTAAFLDKIKEIHGIRLGVTFHVGLSCQSCSSRTIALEGDKLYRDDSGKLILRPGGHGALLENLDALAGDIVFIKNIDNVAPDSLKELVVFYKKVLGGYFVHLEEEIFGHLRTLSAEFPDGGDITSALIFCREKLKLGFSEEFPALTTAEQCRILADKLNRPLRVCGMVKNEGEPGGGPFWVDEGQEETLQIVEHHQIDSTSRQQNAVWSSSTHFNPVDLVCGLRDYRGQSFDLHHFSDLLTVSLSKKQEKGRHIRVLEHPGLWNGAMSRWNTVFVEVPTATFTPVKTIDDLLRPEHQVS